MKELELKLRYEFRNKALLQHALTRKSAITERLSTAASTSYQSLEFLRDAALQYHLADYLIDK